VWKGGTRVGGWGSTEGRGTGWGTGQVLVMDAGVKKEFGTVEELMSIPDGTFRNMVEGAGLSSDSPA
jgi:hypothetical protein